MVNHRSNINIVVKDVNNISETFTGLNLYFQCKGVDSQINSLNAIKNGMQDGKLNREANLLNFLIIVSEILNNSTYNNESKSAAMLPFVVHSLNDALNMQQDNDHRIVTIVLEDVLSNVKGEIYIHGNGTDIKYELDEDGINSAIKNLEEMTD